MKIISNVSIAMDSSIFSTLAKNRPILFTGNMQGNQYNPVVELVIFQA
jgi:hypothetical protein